MKLILLTLSLAITAAFCKDYPTKYDEMEIGEILQNRRLLVSYIHCVLDVGRCTPDARELKSHIGDALATGCQKCTKPQRSGARLVIRHLIRNESDYWNRLVDKYDPKKEYSTKYENELNSLEEPKAEE